MGYPGYVGTNLITSSSMLTVSTEDTVYPKAGLCDGSTVMPFRFTTYEGSVIVDFGVEVSVNAIGVIEHNFGAASTIALKAGSTVACAAWTEYIPYTVTNLFKHFGDQVGQVQSIGPFRYWKFEFNAGGSGPNAYIGELILGAITHFTMGYLYGWTESVTYDKVSAATPKGHTKSYELYNRRSFGYKFAYLSASQITEIKTLAGITKGTLNPFLWVPDTALAVCYYGNLTKDPVYVNQGEFAYQTELGFIESAHIVSIS